MRFRLLGPLTIDSTGGPVVLRRRRERCLLAVLLLHNHAPVPVERLVYLLWDGEPVPTARQLLHSHVSRVRGALKDPAVTLSSTGTSYQIDVDDDVIDARRFGAMVTAARAVTDPAARGALLRDALALWRGDALDDTVSAWLRPRLVGDLDELRLVATEEWLDCEITVGRHTEALPELTRLTAAHPTREGLLGLSMRALHAAGRSIEALAAYRRHQQRLAQEFGLDPGPDLQRLHLAVLRGQPPTATPVTTQASPAPLVPTPLVPAQLPAALRGFTGRDAELARLDALLAQAGRQTVICTVAGTAGVGKTTLVVHWAHQVAARFPDGQLYVNLRGFDRTAPPTDPAEAVRGFLDALDVPPQRVPAGFDAQVALFRSRLAGRRMLVVLDNARDSDQVRPLLPGAGGSLVLVTSRNELSGLHTAEGAEPLPLDLLTTADARRLLAARLGAARVAAEPAAVEEIVAACAGLPLALAIVTARAAHAPLEEVAVSLRNAGRQLDAFTGAERGTDARAVLSWSYAALSPAAARLFRLLGLHPGPDFTADCLPASTGPAVEELLGELTRAHLLTEPAPGRYTCHDLLRAYAGEQAVAVDSPADRRAAQQRMLDHYLHTAYAGTRLLSPHRETLDLDPPPQPADAQQALAWFTAERPVLLAAVDQAERLGFDAHAWQLAWCLATFLDRQGLWRDWLHTSEAGLAAAERLGDRRGAAHLHRLLAHACLKVNRIDDASSHAARALELYEEVGDHVLQAQGHMNLGEIAARRGHTVEGLRHVSQARDLFRAAGGRNGEANALNAMGWLHAQLGDHREAVTACRQALALHQELDNRQGEAETWDTIGYAHHHLGELAEAAACFERAVALFRLTGDRDFEADSLHHLGDTRLAAGDPEAARDTWRRSLEIFEDLDHPDATTVRAKLL
ncbi:BTAD domain-containing putative transcriptional regulator [Dactylosporangium sp. CA-152071]|uniref:AfsR/SARP family transcriptional regulator n=1 Tax=Dactylosporangium sp. CA-152071 TaxID=3239933 RepID=UPI003D949FCC